ncbi:MAG: glutathione S-transferase C-terminal domain-containing protein, partial [Rhodospirillales bacterium]
RFGDGGPFLFGAWSAADSFFAPVVTRFRTYGVGLDPVCTAYVDRVMAWPAVTDWCEAARAESWSIPRFETA